ncbi:hypothetical protein R1sor_000144 [Riccia sorocarpa]|uniref:Uncharacterized protein n=1 Tax=Riccia sorocarpa TaxID=122646 RepID=A0ABD3GUM2_9MARC
MEATDLNALSVNESTGYPLLPDFGPPGGFLKRLQSELRGKYFHSVLSVRDMSGVDLEQAVAFEKAYAESVCVALETRFTDNSIMSCFKILNPRQVPTTAMGIRDWGFKEMDNLCEFFGQSKSSEDGISRPALIEASSIKSEVLKWSMKIFFKKQ